MTTPAKRTKQVNEDVKRKQDAKIAVYKRFADNKDVMAGTTNQEYYKDGVPNRLGDLVRDVAMETIKQLQERFGAAWNPFPANTYVQPGETRHHGPQKRQPKIVTSSTLPPRDADDLLAVAEPNYEDDTDDLYDPQTVGDTQATAAATSHDSVVTTEDATHVADKRKLIVRITQSAKQVLHFLLMRYISELYFTQTDSFLARCPQKSFAQLSELAVMGDYGAETNNKVYKTTAAKRTYSSSVVKHVLATTGQFADIVGNIARSVSTDSIKEHLRVAFADDKVFADIAAVEFGKFLKVLGDALARKLWIEDQSVNSSTILEILMSQVVEFDPNVIDPESFLCVARRFVDELNPGPTEDQRRLANEKRMKARAVKAAGVVQNASFNDLPASDATQPSVQSAAVDMPVSDATQPSVQPEPATETVVASAPPPVARIRKLPGKLLKPPGTAAAQ